MNSGFLLSRQRANFIVLRALSKEIKSDTTKILHKQTETKNDTELIIRELTNVQISLPSNTKQILEAITKLQVQLQSEDPDRQRASQDNLQKCLEDLTSYAGSGYLPSIPSSQIESRSNLPYSYKGADSHETAKLVLSEEVEGAQRSPQIDLSSIIDRLLEVRGSRPGKEVQLLEQE